MGFDSSKETFTFMTIPENLSEMVMMQEAAMDTPFQTAALTMLVLCRYEKDKEAVFDMLDYLNGPETVTPFTKQFLSDRLGGKQYKTFSFFQGATTENGYKPKFPYQITVEANPHSFKEENWATLYVKSSGADSPRSIKLRKKPSTGQWFVTEIQCLSDIRVPAEEDPWA